MLRWKTADEELVILEREMNEKIVPDVGRIKIVGTPNHPRLVASLSRMHMNKDTP